MQFTNASYVKDSIKIIKGKFSYDTGEWVFSDRVDVTDQHKITISEDGQSFVIDLGDITDQDQYRINYKMCIRDSSCSCREFLNTTRRSNLSCFCYITSVFIN